MEATFSAPRFGEMLNQILSNVNDKQSERFYLDIVIIKKIKIKLGIKIVVCV